MTNHPAPDPFAFHPARIERRTSTPEVLIYRLPDGRVLETPVPPASSSICVRAWTPEGVEIPLEAFRIWTQFRKTVAGLSAHQKMAWVASAQQEAEGHT